MNMIETLSAIFKNQIKDSEVPEFRGAVNKSMENSDVLFHNHEEDGFRYSYPLIQYKSIKGYASIVCIGEGTDAIKEFLPKCNSEIMLGDKPVQLEFDHAEIHLTDISIVDKMASYRMTRWLPLNQDNYKTYRQLEGLADKYAFLERILTANILSFAKGLGITFDETVCCKIIGSDQYYDITYKKVKMTACDLNFKCNVTLPDFIGLGKAASTGFGTIEQIRKNQ